MEFALAQEVSESIIKKGISDLITRLSDDLRSYLSDRNYGEGLKEIYIGIICVSPEFEFFFKQRKPKYKLGKQIIIQDEREYESTNVLTYDIKLDYARILDADQREIIKILKTSILQSLGVFDLISIKLFDRTRFESDLGSYLQNYLV